MHMVMIALLKATAQARIIRKLRKQSRRCSLSF